MSVQAELHDPRANYWFSTTRGNKLLLVKTKGNTFRVDQSQILDNTYILRIIKNNVVQAYTSIPQFDETEVYRRGIRVTD